MLFTLNSYSWLFYGGPLAVRLNINVPLVCSHQRRWWQDNPRRVGSLSEARQLCARAELQQVRSRCLARRITTLSLRLFGAPYWCVCVCLLSLDPFTRWSSRCVVTGATGYSICSIPNTHTHIGAITRILKRTVRRVLVLSSSYPDEARIDERDSQVGCQKTVVDCAVCSSLAASSPVLRVRAAVRAHSLLFHSLRPFA